MQESQQCHRSPGPMNKVWAWGTFGPILWRSFLHLPSSPGQPRRWETTAAPRSGIRPHVMSTLNHVLGISMKWNLCFPGIPLILPTAALCLIARGFMRKTLSPSRYCRKVNRSAAKKRGQKVLNILHTHSFYLPTSLQLLLDWHVTQILLLNDFDVCHNQNFTSTQPPNNWSMTHMGLQWYWSSLEFPLSLSNDLGMTTKRRHGTRKQLR